MLKRISSFRKKAITIMSSVPMKIFFTLLAFLFLITLSEIFYVLNNKPTYLFRYYVNKAQGSANNSDAQAAFGYLIKAARINIKHQVKLYPDLIPNKFSPNINLRKNNSQLEQAYLEYIMNLKTGTLIESEEIYLARVFYNLGVLAYRNKETDFTPRLFQTAIYIEPELSHYHVELANFYLKSGNKEQAKSSLEYCLKFKYPIKHCQDYVDNNLSANTAEEVGFLEKELEKYYDSL